MYGVDVVLAVGLKWIVHHGVHMFHMYEHHGWTLVYFALLQKHLFAALKENDGDDDGDVNDDDGDVNDDDDDDDDDIDNLNQNHLFQN